jgi:hypothetical protein
MSGTLNPPKFGLGHLTPLSIQYRVNYPLKPLLAVWESCFDDVDSGLVSAVRKMVRLGLNPPLRLFLPASWLRARRRHSPDLRTTPPIRDPRGASFSLHLGQPDLQFHRRGRAVRARVLVFVIRPWPLPGLCPWPTAPWPHARELEILAVAGS